MLGLKFQERKNNKDRAEMILKVMSNNDVTLFIVRINYGREYIYSYLLYSHEFYQCHLE